MSDQPNSKNHQRVSLTVTNRDSAPIRLYVEPWGEECEMPPGNTLRVDLIAATLQAVAISYGQGSITIDGWQGSTAEIWSDGQLIN